MKKKKPIAVASESDDEEEESETPPRTMKVALPMKAKARSKAMPKAGLQSKANRKKAADAEADDLPEEEEDEVKLYLPMEWIYSGGNDTLQSRHDSMLNTLQQYDVLEWAVYDEEDREIGSAAGFLVGKDPCDRHGTMLSVQDVLGSTEKIHGYMLQDGPVSSYHRVVLHLCGGLASACKVQTTSQQIILRTLKVSRSG